MSTITFAGHHKHRHRLDVPAHLPAIDRTNKSAITKRQKVVKVTLAKVRASSSIPTEEARR